MLYTYFIIIIIIIIIYNKYLIYWFK